MANLRSFVIPSIVALAAVLIQVMWNIAPDEHLTKLVPKGVLWLLLSFVLIAYLVGEMLVDLVARPLTRVSEFQISVGLATLAAAGFLYLLRAPEPIPPSRAERPRFTGSTDDL